MRTLLLLLLSLNCFAQTPGYLNASWFGAVGDNSTDNTAAFRAMFASPEAYGAGIELPPGVYRISDSILISHPCKFYGSSMSAIFQTSANKSGLVITSYGVTLENLSVENHTEASTGTGIRFVTGQFSRVNNVMVSEFYKNMTVEGGSNFNVSNSTFENPLFASFEVSNATNPDQGDYTVYGSTFITGKYPNANSINQYSAGGLRIINNKFNTNGTYKAVKHINIDIHGSTSDLIIQGNSIEHYSENAISVKKQTGSVFSQILITGNQIASYISGAHNDIIIHPSGMVRINVTNNVFLQTNTSMAGISIENANDIVIGGNNCTDELINCTNIQRALTSIPNIAVSGGGTSATDDSNARKNLKVGMVLAEVPQGTTSLVYDLYLLPQGVYNIDAWMVRGGGSANQLYRASYKYFHFGSAGESIITIVPSDAPGNNNGRIAVNGTDLEVYWGGNRGPAAIYAQKIQ